MTVKSLSLAVFLLFPLVAARAQIVSEPVGEVQGHIITSREVTIFYLLGQALAEPEVPIKSQFTDKEKSLASDEYITEWMLAQEAKSLKTFEPKADEIAKAEANVSKRLGANSAWRALQASDKEVREQIIRKLLSKKLYTQRMAAPIEISDSDANAYFEQNRAKFGNLPFENFKATIKDVLARNQRATHLKEWLDILRAKYKARNNLN